MVEILERTVLENGAGYCARLAPSSLKRTKAAGSCLSSPKARRKGSTCASGAKRVILASGDIEGDPEMLEAFCPLALKVHNARYWPKGNNTGDGHKMAYWAGAALDNPPWALSVHGRRDEDASYYSFYFLFVNSRGRRFMNEDTWTQAKAMRVMMQPGDDTAFTIMDAKWLEDYGERFEITGGQGVVPLNIANWGDRWSPDCGLDKAVEQMVEKGRCAWKADTLEELAEKIKVPAANRRPPWTGTTSCTPWGGPRFRQAQRAAHQHSQAPVLRAEMGRVAAGRVRGSGDGYEHAGAGSLHGADTGPLRRRQRRRRLLWGGLSAADERKQLRPGPDLGAGRRGGHRGGQRLSSVKRRPEGG